MPEYTVHVELWSSYGVTVEAIDEMDALAQVNGMAIVDLIAEGDFWAGDIEMTEIYTGLEEEEE